ncbi:hypothetical protein AMAG_19529 [Allomyces macrogynus ATCC 38327]|uniref:GATA-type domain-containing protein n=1 Tax=Allomyces macrogynus (strain ATCC 38327) TaxID=578462 RepID=A0A0L0SWT4_ALLM3|nr:hypothetical protein AMAG_19529 [Allomyces macrogynus ATCC 38327]|eukprot:KNE66819.1 hypothetical protein AMAG_19529 [Allomyces macrogynus ATCC 38327]
MLVQPADALLEELLDLQLANVMLRDRLVHAYAKRHRPIGDLSVLREMLVDPARILHQVANDEDAMDVDAPPPTPFEDPPAVDTDGGDGNAPLPSPTTAASTAAHFLPTAGHGSGLAGVITPSDLVDANLMASRRQPVKTRRVPRKRPADGYVCMDCGTTSSPEWRRGPTGEKCLCNACGIRFAKRKKNVEDAAATTTTPASPAATAAAAAAAVAAAGRTRARTSAAIRARSRGRSSARTRASDAPVTPTRESPVVTAAAAAAAVSSPLAAPMSTELLPLETAPPSTSAALSAPSAHAAIAAAWPTAPVTTAAAAADMRDFPAALDDDAWSAMIAAAAASAMFAAFDERG